MEDFTRHAVIELKESEDLSLLNISSKLATGKNTEDNVSRDRVSQIEEGTQTERTRCVSISTSSPPHRKEDTSTWVNPAMLFDEQYTDNGNIIIEEMMDDSRSGFIMNRILACNDTPALHEILKNIKKDLDDTDEAYSFEPKVLLSLFDERFGINHVTCFDQNLKNDSILAVGYEYFGVGAVAVWCMKNCHSAENFYRLPEIVTAVSFSRKSPNLLAIGFKNGNVSVVDASSTELKVLYSVLGESHHAVCSVQWWQNDDFEAMIFVSSNNVFRWNRPFLSFECKIIMSAVHSAIEREADMGCVVGGVPLSMGPVIRCISRCSSHKYNYLIGGSDGYIRRCNFHTKEHEESTFAHLGVINAIKFCPHHQKIYLTCGSDGKIKIWINGVNRPVITLETEEAGVPIIDACWSPLHGTVLVGVSFYHIFVWTLRRKSVVPVSCIPLETTPNLVRFTTRGDFLMVGTVSGGVQLFALEKMPNPDFYKTDALIEALVRSLVRMGQVQSIGFLLEQ